MSRTPNKWRFFSESNFMTLVGEQKTTGLASTLNVSRSTIDRWINGVIPSERFQVAMSNLRSNFQSLGPANIGRKINDFITATHIDRNMFADLMNVSGKTVTSWIEGRTRPRNKTLLTEILTTPRP